jgi:hypothetical protein
MIESTLLGYGLGDQGVELFGWCETFCLRLSHQVAFLQYVHEFNTNQCGSSRRKRLEPQHGPGGSLHSPMVLLHKIIENFTSRMKIAVRCSLL